MSEPASGPRRRDCSDGGMMNKTDGWSLSCYNHIFYLIHFSVIWRFKKLLRWNNEHLSPGVNRKDTWLADGSEVFWEKYKSSELPNNGLSHSLSISERCCEDYIHTSGLHWWSLEFEHVWSVMYIYSIKISNKIMYILFAFVVFRSCGQFVGRSKRQITNGLSPLPYRATRGCLGRWPPQVRGHCSLSSQPSFSHAAVTYHSNSWGFLALQQVN